MSNGLRQEPDEGVSQETGVFRSGLDKAGTSVSKILAIGLESSSSHDGGLNRYFSQLVAALSELGTPITGLATGEARPGDEDLVEIVAAATASLTTRLRAIASGVRRHADADIVDAHFALTALPVIFGWLRRRPFVVHFQGPWADESALAGEGRFVCGLKRGVERVVYHRADVIVVLSRAFRRVLVERYGVSPWDVHVLRPGVDTEIFSPGDQSEARRVLDLPCDAFVALTVRRLVPRMGLDILLDAWVDLVHFAEAPVIVCIVGAGPHRHVLEAQCAELGLGRFVRFVGQVDDQDLVRYYQAADVSIVPSIALEGFGLVVLESLATGTPVVASALDGLSEALDGLSPDLLVPPGDPEALANRLRGALTRTRPLPTAEVCRRFAMGFSWSEVARRHLELYGDVVGQVTGGRNLESRKLRVVVLGHTAQLSGAELAIHRAMSALTGVQTHAILAQDGPLVALLERDGVSVEILPMKEHARDLRKDQVGSARLPILACAQSAAYVFRLARRMTRVQPDIIHTNTLKAALYGGAAARLARLPCVWHIRDRIAPDYLPPFAVRLVRLAARLLPDAVIVNSRATLETLPEGRRDRATVVYDAVPNVITNRARITAIDPGPAVLPRFEQSRWSSRSANFRVAMVGRLAPWKGQEVFLRAFARAFPEGEEVAVLVGAALFGEDGYERQLRELVGVLGIEERVEFRGFRSDVFEELAGVDVLVHASVIPEPFGQVVIEGMAAGLPVVASGAGGPAEIIVDGETGLLYPPGDVDALARLLRLLVGDAELRSRLGDRAHAAVAMYSPERVGAQILDVYRRLLAGNAQSVDVGAGKRGGSGRRLGRFRMNGAAGGA
jgi:glycosyltransferase involved in cell wall biosynthesis